MRILITAMSPSNWGPSWDHLSPVSFSTWCIFWGAAECPSPLSCYDTPSFLQEDPCIWVESVTGAILVEGVLCWGLWLLVLQYIGPSRVWGL